MIRAKFIISIYFLYIRNYKIVLLRRKNTGYADGMYGLPAGHLEEHESATQGIAREVSEEIGIKTNPEDFHLVQVMHRKESDERLDLFFINEKVTEEPTNAEPEKCDDVQWFSLDHLPENIVPYIKNAIENYQGKILCEERGWK
ncbi:NUDIX domain-containing protein [Candidatus Roizmanbacteria bacterium]|nr:NUDIX domain-containing protein [Candidatus Roizmanbacteria bacterium]